MRTRFVVTFNDTISDKVFVVQAYIRAIIIKYYVVNSRLGDEVCCTSLHAIIQYQTDAKGKGLGCLKSHIRHNKIKNITHVYQ